MNRHVVLFINLSHYSYLPFVSYDMKRFDSQRLTVKSLHIIRYEVSVSNVHMSHLPSVQHVWFAQVRYICIVSCFFNVVLFNRIVSFCLKIPLYDIYLLTTWVTHSCSAYYYYYIFDIKYFILCNCWRWSKKVIISFVIISV